MHTATAEIINRAAAYIGMHLVGVLPCDLERKHIDVIRGVTLPQMQTAVEITEAQNAEPYTPGVTKTIRSYCSPELLEQVKQFADEQPSEAASA